MGFLLYPVVAVIHMETFEKVALESSPYKPKVLFPKMYETFIIWHTKCKPTHTDRYFYALSYHHPTKEQSIISSLVHRAISPSSQLENLQKVLTHKNSLQNNR